jgi:hypothetical protein
MGIIHETNHGWVEARTKSIVICLDEKLENWQMYIIENVMDLEIL